MYIKTPGVANNHPLTVIMRQEDIDQLRISRSSGHYSLACRFEQLGDGTWVCFWVFEDHEHPVQLGTSHPQPSSAIFQTALDTWIGMLLRVLPGKTIVEQVREEAA